MPWGFSKSQAFSESKAVKFWESGGGVAGAVGRFGIENPGGALTAGEGAVLAWPF